MLTYALSTLKNFIKTEYLNAIMIQKPFMI